MFDTLTLEQLSVLLTAIGSKQSEWRASYNGAWADLIRPAYNEILHLYMERKRAEELLPENS